ncbi:MAG: amino acid ABC transporter permease [Rhizobiales bacterium]|nr:amino acid ABC transporter permease [Hyphomicrobiales bacterium]MBI3674902.1 amino acid ABC transporter permease [Hyphomicrobiales bacterium]
MALTPSSVAYLRQEDAPRLPPPASMTGLQGWLRQNLFPSIGSSLVTILFGALALWVLSSIFDFAFLRAVWSGADRQACLGENSGACWPMVAAKMGQWVYGFYPIDQRWRVNVCFVAGAALLAPMLIPSAPYKNWNVALLFLAFPLVTLVLLTGGNFNFDLATYALVISLMLLAAVIVPLAAFGLEEGIACNKAGLGLAGAAVGLWFASFLTGPLQTTIGGTSNSLISILTGLLLLGSGALSIGTAVRRAPRGGFVAAAGWAVGLAGILLAMLLLDFDFGLLPVETPQWGGLTVTLVVSITGIVVSLPVGIVLALGRRSRMPIVRMLSVIYIEIIRGVPLITVLFMSSVMLPLFLPPGTSFDKLLRALIGVAMFSSAYMAEVVRGGLQSIPKGQYEGAMAVGLSFWQMMNKIVLPQALKVSIPNIVGNFISLFKDTTLLLIIGLFDLLGILQASLRDSAWATASSAPTGYLTVALMYWVFCFGMSRYSIYTERRLHTGHKR